MSSVERIRGTSDVPLNLQGIIEAHKIGGHLARKGGLDAIHTSDLGRAQSTAKIISRITDTPIIDTTDKLHPWRLGPLEGKPVSEALHIAHKFMNRYPDARLEGMSAHSTKPGESFNEFKKRVLSYVEKILHELHRNPDLKLAIVTHLRDQKIIEAWVSNGSPKDYQVDKNVLEDLKHAETCSVDRVHQVGGRWAITPVDLKSSSPMPGGLYVIRHGNTDWNS